MWYLVFAICVNYTKMYFCFGVKNVKYYFYLEDIAGGQVDICKYSETKFVPCVWHELMTSSTLVEMCSCPFLG